jgi:nucleotide-binding universal stress UspA family protein
MRQDAAGPARARRTAVPSDPLLGAEGRLVVGFDGSSAGLTALRWAVARAGRSGSAVQITGVVDDEARAMGSAYSSACRQQLAGLLSATQVRLSNTDPGLTVTTDLAVGRVAWALAAAARPDDLLVIGSDKTGYARGRIYGARSIQIAAAATATVAIVPAVELRLRQGIVVALADQEGSDALAAIGAREAVAQRASLALVHAVPVGSDAGRRASAHAVLASAREAAVREGCEQVTTQLAERRPAEAILNICRDKALLIIGRSTSRTSLGVGTTLHELLLNANVPVAIAR